MKLNQSEFQQRKQRDKGNEHQLSAEQLLAEQEAMFQRAKNFEFEMEEPGEPELDVMDDQLPYGEAEEVYEPTTQERIRDLVFATDF